MTGAPIDRRIHPQAVTSVRGPARSCAASRDDGRYPAHRVVPVGSSDKPSRTEVFRTTSEFRSIPPLTQSSARSAKRTKFRQLVGPGLERTSCAQGHDRPRRWRPERGRSRNRRSSRASLVESSSARDDTQLGRSARAGPHFCSQPERRLGRMPS